MGLWGERNAGARAVRVATGRDDDAQLRHAESWESCGAFTRRARWARVGNIGMLFGIVGEGESVWEGEEKERYYRSTPHQGSSVLAGLAAHPPSFGRSFSCSKGVISAGCIQVASIEILLEVEIIISLIQ